MFILAISCVKWSEVRVAQSCLTLCDPMDYTVHGILQARILEWVAILQGIFSRASSEPIAGGFFTHWATREAHFLLDHIQFTLIRGPSIPGSYAALFFTALDFTFITDISTASCLFQPSCCILSGAISNCPLLFPNSILDNFQPGRFIFGCLFFFCLFIQFMGFS